MIRSEAPSQPNGRVVGIVYLSYFLIGSVGALLIKGLIVSGNPSATAGNILAHEITYRASFELTLVANALYLVLTALLYRLFAPVDGSVALIAMLLSFVGCTVQIVGGIFQLAPLVLLKEPPLAAVFTAAQLQTSVLTSFKLYNQMYTISLLLFGFFDISIGYLIVKSTFVPRLIGIAMIIAGIGAMTYLWPPLAASLTLVVLPLGGLAELALLLWLLIKGNTITRAATVS